MSRLTSTKRRRSSPDPYEFVPSEESTELPSKPASFAALRRQKNAKSNAATPKFTSIRKEPEADANIIGVYASKETEEKAEDDSIFNAFLQLTPLDIRTKVVDFTLPDEYIAEAQTEPKQANAVEPKTKPKKANVVKVQTPLPSLPKWPPPPDSEIVDFELPDDFLPLIQKKMSQVEPQQKRPKREIKKKTADKDFEASVDAAITDPSIGQVTNIPTESGNDKITESDEAKNTPTQEERATKSAEKVEKATSGRKKKNSKSENKKNSKPENKKNSKSENTKTPKSGEKRRNSGSEEKVENSKAVEKMKTSERLASTAAHTGNSRKTSIREEKAMENEEGARPEDAQKKQSRMVITKKPEKAADSTTAVDNFRSSNDRAQPHSSSSSLLDLASVALSAGFDDISNSTRNVAPPAAAPRLNYLRSGYWAPLKAKDSNCHTSECQSTPPSSLLGLDNGAESGSGRPADDLDQTQPLTGTQSPPRIRPLSGTQPLSGRSTPKPAATLAPDTQHDKEELKRMDDLDFDGDCDDADPVVIPDSENAQSVINESVDYMGTTFNICGKQDVDRLSSFLVSELEQGKSGTVEVHMAGNDSRSGGVIALFDKLKPSVPSDSNRAGYEKTLADVSRGMDAMEITMTLADDEAMNGLNRAVSVECSAASTHAVPDIVPAKSGRSPIPGCMNEADQLATDNAVARSDQHGDGKKSHGTSSNVANPILDSDQVGESILEADQLDVAGEELIQCPIWVNGCMEGLGDGGHAAAEEVDVNIEMLAPCYTKWEQSWVSNNEDEFEDTDQSAAATSTDGDDHSYWWKPTSRIIFCTSGFNAEGNASKFCEMFGASHEQSISSDVTHVVMKAVRKDRHILCVARTKKYLQAIAQRKWVVSAEWIEQSIKQRRIVSPVPFEIQGDLDTGLHFGPLRARLDCNKLLRDVSVCFHGSFDIGFPEEFLKSLARDAGGMVLESVEKLKMEERTSKTLCLVLAKKPSNEQENDDVHKDNAQEGLASLYATFKLRIVNAEWLLACVNDWRRIPYNDFLLCGRDQFECRSDEKPICVSID